MENNDTTTSEVFNNLLDRQQLRIKIEVMEEEGKPMWNLLSSFASMAGYRILSYTCMGTKKCS